MATQKSSAPAHPSTEDHDRQDERPHVCNDGWVTLGQLVVDPESGEETEEFAFTSVAVARIADSARAGVSFGVSRPLCLASAPSGHI
jgi:hypothetical protein